MSLSADSASAAWVATDPQSQQLFALVRRVAQTPTTVLIRGESGTGKDLLAQLLHSLGPNAAEPCVKIDCAALPPELLESELFGYERGAFTGAARTASSPNSARGATTKSQAASSFRYCRQVRTSTIASAPRMKYRRARGWRRAIQATCSTEYVGRSAAAGTASGDQRRRPASASAVIA